MIQRALRGLAVVAAMSARVEAQSSVRMLVASVQGPRTAAELLAQWPSGRVAQCQTTLLGGVARFAVRIAADGTVTVDSARTDGEEVGLYVPCVRRALQRVHFVARPAETLATVRVEFPSLGLAPR